MFGIGMTELLLILVIGLFLFGNHLPKMAHSFGKVLGDFQKEVGNLKEETSLSS